MDSGRSWIACSTRSLSTACNFEAKIEFSGNIAGDSSEARMQLVAHGVILALATIVIAARSGSAGSAGPAALHAAQIAAWALSNYIRGADNEVRVPSLL